MSADNKPDRLIFQTLKAVVDSKSALSVRDLEDITGFNLRTLQHHLDELSKIDLTSRLNKNLDQGKGYLYISNIKFIS